ncbi:MAG: LLM class flavin-dependent oxidoreductase [Actinobacteria bacterium]|nr:LLM class flavin-dependent oxidoreductase [Actinomycetota bacterium]
MTLTPLRSRRGSTNVEVGLFTFGDLFPDPVTGRVPSAQQRLGEILAVAELADRYGLDLFGVGEHHSSLFAISSPVTVLAAIATATRRIRLSSAVTILSSADPVRVFQEFATLDLLSGGRAEIMAGRGAFTESFPLFGYRLEDYEMLFEEHLDLLLRVNEATPVTWSGHHRPALAKAEITPRPVQQALPIWLAVGGTPTSVVRAGRLGLPMTLGLIGGMSERFAPLAELYRRTGREAGHDDAALQIGITGHFYVAATRAQAYEEFYPHYAAYLRVVSRSRGQEWRVSRADFQSLASLPGVLFVGDPDDIVAKVNYQHELFGHSRFMAQHDVGGLGYAKVASSVQLLASEVVPAVRELMPA